MTDNTLRIGVIGAGRNTVERHIPGLQAIDDVVIAGVCNRSLESSDAVAKQFNIARVHKNWWDLVAAPDTDAVVIGTWPYMHHPITLAALEQGKHVMCEARMAMNATEAREMLSAARRHAHLVTQIVPSPMTLAVDNSIQRLIVEDYLGDILAVEIKATGDGAFLERDAALHWRQNAGFSGHNIMSLGIWYEALMRWVGEAAQVTAMGKTYIQMRLDPETGIQEAVRVPEHLNVIAEMVCGAQASFMFSSVTGLAGDDSATLYGSHGTLRVCADKLFGGRRGDAALMEIEIPPEQQGGWRVEEEFVNAIRGLEPITHTTFEDGLRYMLFTDAVTLSMAEGRRVHLASV